MDKVVTFVNVLAVALALPLTAQTLLGTSEFTASGDFAARMVNGIHEYLDRETRSVTSNRAVVLNGAPEKRNRLRKITGAVDPRVRFEGLGLQATTSQTAVVTAGAAYRVLTVRWPVLDGLSGEGLLLEPISPPVARVVAIPDADWTPEMLSGITPGVPPRAQFARRLAEQGCQVVVPLLIDRRDTYSGVPGIRMTNQPHREFIYRMAFEAGRHIIGYEVQKVLALVDWFESENRARRVPVGVVGYGEGGLLALYGAAVDARIETVMVSGYFQPREQLWREPIYRDVWGLLREFGDAEMAALAAGRVTVEASPFPAASGPPPETRERRGAAPAGSIETPPDEAVRREVERARELGAKITLIEGAEAPGTEKALSAFLGVTRLKPSAPAGVDAREGYDPAPRAKSQFDEMVSYTQAVLRKSPARRAEFWGKSDPSSVERWRATTKPMRQYIWDEVIGRLPDPSLPINPRTRLIYDEPKFRGYEVMLDVWPDVFAYGILLVPKNVTVGERRPVVVCQHGLEGRSQDVADPKSDNPAYHRYAARLAEEGFVTYAPQNPYIGQDRFRQIQRKAHPLKLSLFSFILGQHQRTLEWLSTLPFVDASRIGFYGLSYGGKTAVRVPPLLDGYALSICSADFNEWVWKTTSVDSPYSYMLTPEYDMLEFDFANVVNYGELAGLMAPRPFMVERGHGDGVAPDEWVAYEFAKVRRLYDRLGIGGSAAIEFFNGPHTIHGIGTFEFLRRHLRWAN